MKTYKECCREVAIRHGLGKSLVTGHRAGYWEEAAEMHVAQFKEDNEMLKALVEKFKPKGIVDKD